MNATPTTPDANPPRYTPTPPAVILVPVFPVRSSLRVQQELEILRHGYALGGEYRERRTLR